MFARLILEQSYYRQKKKMSIVYSVLYVRFEMSFLWMPEMILDIHWEIFNWEFIVIIIKTGIYLL